MSARWGDAGSTPRLPRMLRRRAARREQQRVEAFLAAIRATAPEGTLVDIDPPTVALPMLLVTLLVPVR